MSVKLTQIPKLSGEELSDRESLLLVLLQEREERIQQLEDEIARLKGEKGKPKIKPSRLEPSEKVQTPDEEGMESGDPESQAKKKRPGSDKRHKTASLPIHETTIIQPTKEIPTGSEFRGYQDYTVQELIVRAHNIRYRLAIWKTPTGKFLTRTATRTG